MSVQFVAALGERDDEQVAGRVIARGRPVVAALLAGTRLNPLIGLAVGDVVAIGRHSGLGIDVHEHVLQHGFFVIEKLAVAPVQLPQDAGLANRHDGLLRTVIDQHALEHLVQIKRLAWRVAVIPFQLAGVGIERERGAGIERSAVPGAAARPHPGLGLGHAPVSEIKVRIVGARQPRGAAASRPDLALPRITARFARRGYGVSAPLFFAGFRVECGYKTTDAELTTRCAHHYLATSDERRERDVVSGFVVRHGGGPDFLASLGVEGHENRFTGGEVNVAAVESDSAAGIVRDHGPCRPWSLVAPEKVTRAHVERHLSLLDM